MQGAFRAVRYPVKALAWLSAAALAAAALAAVLSYYMESGEIISPPRGGPATIALLDRPDVRLVMYDICRQNPSREEPPRVLAREYSDLLASGAIAKLAAGTRVSVLSRDIGAGMSGLWSIKVRSGPWSGRRGWTCPGSLVLLHAYP